MRTYRVTAALLVALVFFARSSPTMAQCELYEDAKLTASDAADSDYFGNSVSVSGNVAVVGSHDYLCDEGTYCGAAYVYRFDGGTWVEEQKLRAPDVTTNDGFGMSGSVSGDVIVVGRSLDDCTAGIICGSAHVYRFDGGTWVEEQKLTASDAAPQDRFGWSVSVSGDLAVVGAFLDDCAAGFDCGSAYVFRFNGSTWVEEQKLTASDAAQEDSFGYSVSASGDVVVVQALYDDCAAGFYCGSAYVYRFNGSTWVQEQKLSPPFGAGRAVSVSGDVVVKGANGSAYVYRFNGSTWAEEANLTGSDAEPSDSFGYSVSISGETAVVGTLSGHCPGSPNTPFLHGCGSAYVYRLIGGTWVEQVKLGTSDDFRMDDHLGISVAISGNTAIAGASYRECMGGPDCGSAYVYGLGGTVVPCGGKKNRYLSLSVLPHTTGGAGPSTALRVTPVDLQNPNPANAPCCPAQDFSAYEAGSCTAVGEMNGCARWVGKPGVFLESQDIPAQGSFKAARLQCTPYYHDWSSEGLIHVVGAEVMPSSTYEVENLAASCTGIEDTCTDVSATLTVFTARYGDVAAPFNPPATSTQPDAIDVTQLVNKFKNVVGAPSKVIGQIQPNLPELNADINALDVVAVVDGVKGKAYAYSGPCACPSVVPCGVTACTSVTPCVTAYGAGAMCVKTCGGGDNDGDPCINNTHCPGGGTCGNGFCRDRCGRCTP